MQETHVLDVIYFTTRITVLNITITVLKTVRSHTCMMGSKNLHKTHLELTTSYFVKCNNLNLIWFTLFSRTSKFSLSVALNVTNELYISHTSVSISSSDTSIRRAILNITIRTIVSNSVQRPCPNSSLWSLQKSDVFFLL